MVVYIKKTGTGDDIVPVVHLWGTPYEKGFAHGTLMKERMSVRRCMNVMLLFFNEAVLC